MNKGFTLIEMLATIIILGILVTIVLLSANRLISSSNLEYYNTSEKMMILASKDYFEKYISANDSVNIYKVTLKDLEDANKNGEEYDLKGLEKCDKEKTFANISINYQNGTAKKAQVELKC